MHTWPFQPTGLKNGRFGATVSRILHHRSNRLGRFSRYTALLISIQQIEVDIESIRHGT
ncbi:hypothetical protein HSB1_13440 [Halogranum salarium B-1]|uniref:Uncharacterized protein n=1 Tax=Halogranum salarium B-1 TaxID=1210908 RepID=J3JH75_9EURY|nr:hypothetical protein HSB1_13440 [Halogranum salarium B-1]